MYQTEKEKNCETCIHTGLCKFEKAYREIQKDIIEKAEQSTRYQKYGDITVEIKCNNFKENRNRINYNGYLVRKPIGLDISCQPADMTCDEEN